MPLMSAVILPIAAVSSAVVLFWVPGELSAAWSGSSPFVVVVVAALKLVRLALSGCARYTTAARRSACSRLTKLVSGTDVALIRLGARSRFSQLVMDEYAT